NQLGDWAGASGQVPWMADGHPRDLTETVLDGFRAAVPADWQVSYARGCNIEVLRPHPWGDTLPDGQPLPKVFSSAPVDPDLQDEAVALARNSDVAVVVLGDTVHLTGEHKPTATLELQGGQQALLAAVAATGTPLVVVLLSGKPQILPPAALVANALIQAFNPGMRGGRAVAELVLGRIEPSGRLPVSIPRHIGQTPVYYNQLRGQHGDSYADLTQDPSFVFGEGLSYSTIEYSDLEVLTPSVAVDGVIRVAVRVSNTGTRPALETVQLYISDEITSVTWADRELKTYTQVALLPGETRLVELALPASACTLVDAEGTRLVEPGRFELLVGPNSRRSALLSGTVTIG
ncbi:MAG: glycoside hydrolase family 3 C-terminal domain-containing protein, partial [Micropruina sp.]